MRIKNIWVKVACLRFMLFILFMLFCAFYAFSVYKKHLGESCLFVFCNFCNNSDSSILWSRFSLIYSEIFEAMFWRSHKKMEWYHHKVCSATCNSTSTMSAKFHSVSYILVYTASGNIIRIHAFFYKQRFFSTQLQCYLTFSWIELQMLLRCCLIYMSIIILRNFLYLLFLCPFLGLGLFMSCLVLNLIFIFIMINVIISSMQTLLLFCLFFRICPIVFGW